METVSSQTMLSSIQCGFKKAIATTDAIVDKHKRSAAAHLSSKFVYEVACAIRRDHFLAYDLKVIPVDSDGDKRSGEWLVDACITEGTGKFIDRIVFAMESESATSKKAFDEDFAKLVHLDAAVKLHLNGLKQTNKDRMKRYIEDRCNYAAKVIKRTRPVGQWFLGFWPSPGKLAGTTKTSAWECLPPHLEAIRLFEFRGSFIEVHGSNATLPHASPNPDS